MSLFAFGVIVNTKRLQILKISHLERDICIENEIIDFLNYCGGLASRCSPLPPQTQQYRGRKQDRTAPVLR